MITMKSPKFKFLSVLFFSLVFNAHAQVQTIWTEDFNNGCTGGCYASAFNGINGAWSVTSPGANGNVANDWFVSGAECGMLPGQCGIDCGATNASLHISVNVSIMGIDLIDLGAAYLAGGAALGGDATTNRRAESPVINSTGFTNLQLSFSYIENGQGSIDNAEVWIFDGATWALLADMAKTNCCDGGGASTPCTGNNQGLWSQFAINMPASTFNNPNLRIGFRWVNNNDELGTDPSVAIDNVVITAEPAGGGGAPVADFTFLPANPCVGAQVTFTDNSTGTVNPAYNWNFGPNAIPPTANTVGPHTVVFTTPGIQTVSLTVTNGDGSGSNTLTQDVNVSPGPTVTAFPNITICSGGSTVISASGANAYQWDNGLGIGASHTVSPTVTTTYNVVGVDLAGCAGTASVTVTVSGVGPTLVMSAVDALCFGTATGQASVVATGSGPFSYSWSPTGGTYATANNLFPGNYTVSVTDAQGCISTGSATVASPSQIVPNGSVTNTDCNINNGSILVNPSGGNSPYSYVWLPGGSTNALLANLGAGAYQVNITDANNCSVSANFSVELNNSFIVSVDPPVSTIQYQESVLLDVTIVPDVPGATYSWSPIAGLSCTDCPNPIAAPISNTTYTVTVTAPNGCTQTAQATVNVQLPCGAAFMPTIFSPNGDNLNDELCLMGSCVQTMTYSIYNKWGELVFSSNKQSDCWDGTFRGKPAPMGGYAYKLQVTLTDGTIQEESGNITLAR
jgi:gliding motility-associated-like protein